MNVIPEWTQKVEHIGLDPLGLQNSGVALYQALMPGIGNVTQRLRYYGLYCWLSDAYARKEGDTDPAKWRRWVRRCEALYALAAVAHATEPGVAGVEWAGEVLKQNDHAIDLRPATEAKGERQYLRQSMGIFGGAYGSQMATVGLLHQADTQEPLLVVTPELGIPMAEKFGNAIGDDVAATILNVIETGLVDRQNLATLTVALPSSISPTSPEAESYRQILFGEPRESEELTNPINSSRRLSLILILRVADRLSRLPSPDAIRWELFNPSNWNLPEALEDQRVRWEAYQTHDLFQLACAGVFRWSLDVLGRYDGQFNFSGLALESATALLDECGISLDGAWTDFVSRYASQDACRDLSRDLGSISDAGGMTAAKALSSLKLIATLQARLADRHDLRAVLDQCFGPDTRMRSVRSEIEFLEAKASLPLIEFIATFLEHRILRRHYAVALQKFRNRDYTFLFDSQDGRLRRRATYTPVLTTPRLGPAVNFLRDCGCLRELGLTDLGRSYADAAQ